MGRGCWSEGFFFSLVGVAAVRAGAINLKSTTSLVIDLPMLQLQEPASLSAQSWVNHGDPADLVSGAGRPLHEAAGFSQPPLGLLHQRQNPKSQLGARW
jgi:hypothetical protein